MGDVVHPYADRPTWFVGVVTAQGFRLKTYDVSFDGRRPDPLVYEAGMRLVAPLLPQPPVTNGRYGVGYMIRHRGRGEDYLVAHWWDQENEIFGHVATTPNDDACGWSLAGKGQVTCVWDLLIIKFERDLFVKTILSQAGPPDIESYMSRHYSAES